MKKKLISLLLAASMACTLAACGQKAPAETKPAETPAPEASSTEAQTEAPKADLEDSLVIYTTHGEDLVGEIADAFTEATGVKVEFINLKGELADRVETEKENPQADIMFGGDAATYLRLDAAGCYAEVTPSWADEINPAFKAENNHWFGTIKTPVMMFYNSDVLTAETAPKDWSDLTKDEFKDMIVTRDSLSSSMRSCVCALVYNLTKDGDETAAWDYLAGLDKNIKNYYNSGSMMYEAIGKGEASISIAVMSDIIKNRDKNGLPFEMIDAESGSVVLTDCIAALNNAPHPNAAAAFVDFAGSAKVQAMIANDFSRIPTLDSALPECPEWMSTAFKAMDTDWTVVGDKQSEWLEKWETDILDNNKTVAAQ